MPPATPILVLVSGIDYQYVGDGKDAVGGVVIVVVVGVQLCIDGVGYQII